MSEHKVNFPGKNKAKVGYDTREAAQVQADMHNGNYAYKHLYTVYRCSVCKMWHVGRQRSLTNWKSTEQRTAHYDEIMVGKLIGALSKVLRKSANMGDK